MEIKSATGEAKKANGETLAESIKYDYKWSIYTTFAEMVSANDTLSEEEQLKVRNEERQLKARGKAQSAAFEAAGIVKPTLETSEQLQLQTVFKALMASKKHTEEAARVIASTTLGIEWAK